MWQNRQTKQQQQQQQQQQTEPILRLGCQD